MSHEHHLSKKTAAEIGLGAAGIAAAGAASVYLARKRERMKRALSLDEAAAEEYRANLRLFDEPALNEQIRQRMAQLAVRIYHASRDSTELVIMRKQLMGDLDLNKQLFSDSMGYLQQYHLVSRKSMVSNPRAHGYYAMPSLVWGMEYESVSETLAEAEADLLSQQLGL